jgi:hypothetical protein
MSHFNDINYLKYHSDKYVFFDIFHKNNKIIMICPVYYQNYDYTKIGLFDTNNIINLSQKNFKNKI